MNITFSDYDFIEGGVCASVGFTASGVHCGLRKNKEKPDLALVYSDEVCNVAAVYTQNKVKGATILVTKEHVKSGKAQAIIVNSGNANTCNIDGVEKAEMMCKLIADELCIDEANVVVASTGIIGEILPIEPIEKAIPKLKANLDIKGNEMASQAILTTDTAKKEFAVSFMLGGKLCHLGGMAKGSGMIHPNMATMLCFMTTDVFISPKLLQKALSDITADTFNMVSIDGDTSTNDMAVVMASGKAENEPICDETSPEYKIFHKALFCIMVNLSRSIAQDGEGATKLLECSVTGAKDKPSAKIIAKSVITSSLFKSAMFGQDPNWGRILCAVGYAEADVDVDNVEVILKSANGEVCVCQNGRGMKFQPAKAKSILSDSEVKIIISLKDGEGKAVAWGCDLTYDYVKINAAYHT